MPLKTFGNNGKNISENIVKLNRQIFDNFLISLLDKIEDTVHS